MKIVCLTVGKKHDSDLAAVIAKYQTRLNAYTNFEFEYINTSTIDTESEAMISRINATDKVILLDETGTLLTNLHLAQHLDAMQTSRLSD